MSKSSKDQIEQDEKQIISELIKNSKENIDTIAKHCGFSRQKTWRMIKQLEEKGLIWGYSTVFDEKRIGLTHFILLIKRSIAQADNKVVEVIISRKLEKIATENGITIENSAFIHGEYDWIVTFIAKDIKEAKNFTNKLVALYPNVIQNITLMQTLFFMRKHHILNPERTQLRDFL